MSTTTRTYIGLGANLGDGTATLHTVLDKIATLPGVLRCQSSAFYRSAPIQASGPDFINAVAALDTTLAPLDLLDALQVLENRHGRKRPYKNAPRILDLDLLLYGELTMDTPRLILPHPRLHERAFVLLPLRDLAPDLHLPQGSYTDLLRAVSDQAIERL